MTKIWAFRLLLPAAILIVVFLTIEINNQQKNHSDISQENNHPAQEDEPMSLKYFKKIYANPQTGKVGQPSPMVQSYWLRKIQAQRLATRNKEDEIEWVESGPTNVGGRTRAIAVDSQDPDRLIAGGVRGGLWVSENHGERWEHVKGITENESITFLTQHPKIHQNWYASTGEFVGSGANFFGGGLLYSIDNGNNWSIEHYTYLYDTLHRDYIYKASSEIPISSAPSNSEREGFPFQYSSKILVHPDSNSIFVATHGWGILKSTDDIQSFTHAFRHIDYPLASL